MISLDSWGGKCLFSYKNIYNTEDWFNTPLKEKYTLHYYLSCPDYKIILTILN